LICRLPRPPPLFAGILLALAIADHSSAIELGPKTFPLSVLGVRVEIPVTASVEARTEGDSLVVNLKAQGGLKNVQDKALQIAKTIPVPTGNCDKEGINPVVDSIDSATIAPSGNAAVIALKGHVTAWLCKHVLGQTVKTKIASDEVQLSASVEVVIIDQKRIGLKLASPVSVVTGSRLTDEAIKLLGVDASASITSALAKALDASEAQASVPAVPGLDATIQSATFATDGAALLIRAEAAAKMNSEAFNELLKLMSR
jgi:hypothetical protein